MDENSVDWVGQFKDTSVGFETPADWIEISLTAFINFISIDYPIGFVKPVGGDNDTHYKKRQMIEALERVLDDITYKRPYNPIEEIHDNNLSVWYSEAVRGFLEEEFKAIPERWYEGTDHKTDKTMRKAKRNSLRAILNALTSI